MRAEELRRALSDLGDAERVDSTAVLGVVRRRARVVRARRAVAGVAAVAALSAGAVAVAGGDDGDGGGIDVTATDPAVTEPTVTEPMVTEPMAGGATAPTTEAGWAPAPGAWTALPPGPLSAREAAAAVWTGEELLLLGGLGGPPCPPNADCTTAGEPLVDGAAFDPVGGTWRVLAPAPATMVSDAVVVGGTVYALGWDDPTHRGLGHIWLLAYDVAGDSWSIVAGPDGGWMQVPRLAAAGDRVLAFQGSNEQQPVPDLLYDPATGTWSELPVAPFEPTYDRSVVAVGDRLVLLAIPTHELGATGPPRYEAAVLEPGAAAWIPLPTGDVVGGWPGWFVVDGLVVNPATGSADGGATNGWGRSYPFGGILDPVTGTWSALPAAPAIPYEAYAQPRAGDGLLLADRPLVLDLAAATWTSLPSFPGQAEQGVSVTWAGDALVVWGGAWFPRAMDGELLSEGWIWMPA
jgi:hypothetical protein